MKNALDIVKIQNICMQAILCKKDADSFVQELYSVLKLPIIVFDETISLISYAFKRPYHFKDWDEIAQFGSSPQKKIMDYVLDDYQKIIYSNKKPTLINWGTCHDNPQICCPIIHNDFLYGYIGIALDDCPFTDEVMEVSELSAKVLGCLLDFQYKKSDSIDIYTAEEFAQQLLLNNNPQPDILMSYAAKYKPLYLVCVITLSKPNDAKLQYTLGYIAKNIKNSIACSCGNDHIYILLSDLNPEILEDNLSLFADLSVQQGFLCGISDYFTDISILSSHKTQALKAKAVGHFFNPKKNILMFKNLYIDIVCCNYIEKLGDTASVPYSLRKLDAIDKQGQKNYIDTLTCYIENFMKLSDTAEALNIHPNTVRFRIDRIYEILKNDLKDPEYVQNLYAGLRILKIIYKRKTLNTAKSDDTGVMI